MVCTPFHIKASLNQSSACSMSLPQALTQDEKTGHDVQLRAIQEYLCLDTIYVANAHNKRLTIAV